MLSISDSAKKLKEINKHIEAQERKVAEAKEEFKTINLEIIELYKVERNLDQEQRLQELKEQRAKNAFDEEDAERVLSVFTEQLKQAEKELKEEIKLDNINKYNKLAEQREVLERDIEKILALLVGDIDKLKNIDAEQRAILQTCKISSGYRAVTAILEDYLAYKLKPYFDFFPRSTVSGGLVDIDNMNKKINL